MLTELTIRSIALIDFLRVSFTGGMNVLTGETGAGKSIIVGALDLVLGGRADKERIASDAERGTVEALFDISGVPALPPLLEKMGLSTEDGLLPISREITRSGRSICRVAGMVVPLSQLREITSMLVDLHGQHAHQSLLDPAKHLGFLDALGDESHRRMMTDAAERYRAWHTVKSEAEKLRNSAMERARREDMLRFQLEELDSAKLVAGEEDALESSREAMRAAGKIRSALEHVYDLLEGSDASASDSMRQAAKKLDTLARYGESYEKLSSQLWDLVYTLEGVSADLDALRSGCTDDPRKLEKAEARLDLLSRLKRKYGATTHEMIIYREKIRNELDSAECDVHRIEVLTREEEQARQRFEQSAALLSKSRAALARVCRERILQELSSLGMGKADFLVNIETCPPSIAGCDRVEFLLSANTGEALHPLSKVASGGELSRVMLAFKCVEADREGIPVLVFDEIDTGISGRIGQAVGEKMKAVSARRQVLCVTHLPQIAAMADAQYLVAKHEQEGRTHTQLTLLDTNGRVQVLGEMLGGGETGNEHARSLLERNA